MCVSSYCHSACDLPSFYRLLNASEDFRQTNCGVPFGIDRLTLSKRKSRHMTSLTEEPGKHLL